MSGQISLEVAVRAMADTIHRLVIEAAELRKEKERLDKENERLSDLIDALKKSKD